MIKDKDTPYELYIYLAENGHVEAAQMLLTDIATFNKEGKTLPPNLGKYFSLCVNKASKNNWDITSTFNLKGRKRGQQSFKTAIRNLNIVNDVQAHIDKGKTNDFAYNEVAKNYPLEKDSIRKIHEAFVKRAKRIFTEGFDSDTFILKLIGIMK